MAGHDRGVYRQGRLELSEGQLAAHPQQLDPVPKHVERPPLVERLPNQVGERFAGAPGRGSSPAPRRPSDRLPGLTRRGPPGTRLGPDRRRRHPPGRTASRPGSGARRFLWGGFSDGGMAIDPSDQGGGVGRCQNLFCVSVYVVGAPGVGFRLVCPRVHSMLFVCAEIDLDTHKRLCVY